MFFLRTTCYSNVVKINKSIFQVLRLYDLIHDSLKYCNTISDSKWYPIEFVQSPVSFESSELFVRFFDWHLMISTFHIESRKILILCQIIHQIIDSWERVRISIRVCIDGLGKIDTHSLFMLTSIILGNYNLSFPRTSALSNNTFFLQFIHLFLDELPIFFTILSRF